MVEEKTKKERLFGIDLEEMVRAGLHFGHEKSKLHPKMKPYVFGIRKTVHIINLEETADKLEKALEYIRILVSENKVLLLVGTKIQHKELVETIAKECGLPYVSERWLGGFLTNFSVMKQRVIYFQKLRERMKSGELEKYGKKEQARIKRELRNLEVKFAGIESLEKMPDAIFICDINKDSITLEEAKKKKVPIIAIVDTNTNPTPIDWPIPASDDAVNSLTYILNKVKEVIKSAKEKQTG